MRVYMYLFYLVLWYNIVICIINVWEWDNELNIGKEKRF